MSDEPIKMREDTCQLLAELADPGTLATSLFEFEQGDITQGDEEDATSEWEQEQIKMLKRQRALSCELRVSNFGFDDKEQDKDRMMLRDKEKEKETETGEKECTKEAKLTAAEVSQWGIDEVCEWLRGLKLDDVTDDYIARFRANHIDGDVLLSLTHEDLEEKELNIESFGHRKKILKAVEDLNSTLTQS